MNTKTLYRIAGTLVGLFAIILQYYLIINAASKTGASYLSETIRFLSFMTIWSNIVVTCCLGIPLLFPKSKTSAFLQRPVVETAVMLYILVVMIVYHFLLAKIWDPQGWQKVADITLHYIVPIIFIIYWIIFTAKGNLKLKHAFNWLIYPVIYIAYSLIRGAIVQQYPYYFVDAESLGYPVALRNTLFILIAYLILGIVVVFISNLLAAKPKQI